MHHPSIPPSPLVAKTTDFGRAVSALATGGAVEVDAETVVVDIQCGSLDGQFNFVLVLDFGFCGCGLVGGSSQQRGHALEIED
jgi:hypothetical protein